jgi:hypothetical protein
LDFRSLSFQRPCAPILLVTEIIMRSNVVGGGAEDHVRLTRITQQERGKAWPSIPGLRAHSSQPAPAFCRRLDPLPRRPRRRWQAAGDWERGLQGNRFSPRLPPGLRGEVIIDQVSPESGRGRAPSGPGTVGLLIGTEWCSEPR